MTVAFICGSLEPGRDGVGDYVRRLAAELSRLGHRAALVAINDASLSDESSAMQNSDGIELPALRLPATWTAARRFSRSGEWLKGFAPDWVSVQFVPFAFEKRGLPFGLKNQLQTLTGNRRCHMMFHELWVGMKNDSPWKMRAWGWVQRQLIQSVIHGLQPARMHTQTHLYVAQLAKYGFAASFLPLFGNIPVATFESAKQNPGLAFIHFGSIYPDASIAAFVNELSQHAKRTHQEASLTLIGRGGAGKDSWLTLWRDAGMKIHDLGELPPELISRHLSKATAGITSTPYALVEKSGSVAAMREHGLPVICVSQNWVPTGIRPAPFTSDVVEYEEGNLGDLLGNLRKPSHSADLAQISRQFIEDLKSSERL